MSEMLLDRNCDAQVPAGYFLVSSEVEFLQHAVSSQPLLIRGHILCDWAETFCRARKLPFAEAPSPTRELQTLCPTLTGQDIKALVSRLGPAFFDLERPLTVVRILQALDPRPLWNETQPGPAQAAEWLLWVYAANPAAWLQPLLASVSEPWRRAAVPELAEPYAATDSETALHLLDGWLWLQSNSRWAKLGEFPADVPAELVDRARDVWRERATATRGAFFEDLYSEPAPYKLKQVAAHEAWLYYVHRPQDLTEDRLQHLAEFLPREEQNVLRRVLAPTKPGDLPETPEGVLHWFEKEYLPYRGWQSQNSVAEALPDVEHAARQFADWYLDRYPQALMGHPMRQMLSFIRVRGLAGTQPNAVVLLIVLDGLHAGDARLLEQKVRAATSGRLTILERRLAFAPLPTVTQFCKDSLLKGVPPALAKDLPEVGMLLPESGRPVEKLRHTHAGQLYIWSLLEPDHIYHSRNTYESLLQDVETQLDGLARKIADIVKQIPQELPLQIVITTDHGRIMARCPRRIPVPPGMQSHGRAAWGSSEAQFDDTGYAVVGNLVYLHASRFGMAEDVAMCLGQDAFETNDGKGGVEAYPHGGLYPEEVIVPWLALARDVEKPAMIITISGRGTAGKHGQLALKVSNANDIGVGLVNVQLYFPVFGTIVLPCEAQLTARATETYLLDLEPWPSGDDAKHARQGSLAATERDDLRVGRPRRYSERGNVSS